MRALLTLVRRSADDFSSGSLLHGYAPSGRGRADEATRHDGTS